MNMHLYTFGMVWVIAPTGEQALAAVREHYGLAITEVPVAHPREQALNWMLTRPNTIDLWIDEQGVVSPGEDPLPADYREKIKPF